MLANYVFHAVVLGCMVVRWTLATEEPRLVPGYTDVR